MLRFALVLLLVFAVLVFFRLLRVALERLRARSAARPPAVDAEMVRDPVCGAWVDPRLALAAWTSGRRVGVCSEACRRAIEAS